MAPTDRLLAFGAMSFLLTDALGENVVSVLGIGVALWARSNERQIYDTPMGSA